MSKTILRKINIEKFRGLKDIEVEFGERITVICGKNGTSKSTILGIAAQIFSYDKDYSKKDLVTISAKTLHGGDFKSLPSDHFRLSKRFDDVSGSKIHIDLHDGYFNKTPEKLQLSFTKSSDRPYPRPVVRNNIESSTGNTSRNVTHPVIYLSLSRLLPISQRKSYTTVDIEYLNANAERFSQLSNRILSKNGSNSVTATRGDINSAVAHGESYDHDSVSSGEDNVGQIVSALMSFEKLKAESPEYHGGLLIIDEADAGLFPAAQSDFINLLASISNKLNLQVVISSHSPIMIKGVYSLGQSSKDNKYKVVYLTDTFGDIVVRQDVSWLDIITDLKIETVNHTKELAYPKINVYFEDGEAYDFFYKLVRSRKLLKFFNLIKDVTLGCDQYMSLIKAGVKEFSENSILVFDADVTIDKKYKNCVKLPGSVPPDQLVFEFLAKKPASDTKFWDNKYNYTKAVFMRDNRSLRESLGIADADMSIDTDFAELVDSRNKAKEFKETPRVMFKKFYKSEHIQGLIKGPQEYNPFHLWALDNSEEVENFNKAFIEAAKCVYSNSYNIEPDFL
ncbi:ATP-binding protein [bacterium Scap17]|nr:ATP-binding protein [bacterium Scap17]